MTTREHSGLSSSPAENKTWSYINENNIFSSVISTKEIVFKRLAGIDHHKDIQLVCCK